MSQNRDNVRRGFIMSILGESIKRFRVARGMLQSDLAGLVGVTRSTIIRWEAGEFEPKASQLDTIATALSAKTDWLLHPEELAQNA